MKERNLHASLLFDEKVHQITNFFSEDGWITVYEEGGQLGDDETLIYCGLIKPSELEDYLEDSDWRIDPGREGRPSVYVTWPDGKAKYDYHSFADDSLEPFVFFKTFVFDRSSDSYVDISEEFILYFKLYETGIDKKNRKFYFLKDGGDLDEVIVVEPKKIKIKLKYLKEYLAARQLFLSVCFDFMRFIKIEDLAGRWAQSDEDFITANYNYNHYVRISPSDATKVQTWIHGKVIVFYSESKQSSRHFEDSKKYESFIVGFDSDGEEILIPCNNKDDYQYQLIYFKKQVLDKYYQDPSRYTVGSLEIEGGFFNLRIDNNMDEFVAVFLKDLISLPDNDQIYWKSFNVPPQKQLSSTFNETFIEGNWDAIPQAVDQYLKWNYSEFNKKWEKKFGWPFFMPLHSVNVRHFKTLHVPTSNNEKSFYDQILSLVIITIDSMNQSEFVNGMPRPRPEGSLNRLEEFLKVKNIQIPKMMSFLRHLQKLRSGAAAHRYSMSDEGIAKSIQYFGITDNNYVAVVRDIFEKMIFTMNSLERKLLDSNNIKNSSG